MPEDRDFKKVSKEGFEGDIEGYFKGDFKGDFKGNFKWDFKGSYEVDCCRD